MLLIFTVFQPTLPMRGATQAQDNKMMSFIFQPTLPMRGATLNFGVAVNERVKFQPTLPMRGATVKRLIFDEYIRISTHAPHAGSDFDLP